MMETKQCSAMTKNGTRCAKMVKVGLFEPALCNVHYDYPIRPAGLPHCGWLWLITNLP